MGLAIGTSVDLALGAMEYTDDLKPVVSCSTKQDVAFYRYAPESRREIGSFAPHIRLSDQHPYLFLDLGEVVGGLGWAPSAQAELIDLPQILPRRRGNDQFDCVRNSGGGFDGFKQLVKAFPRINGPTMSSVQLVQAGADLFAQTRQLDFVNPVIATVHEAQGFSDDFAGIVVEATFNLSLDSGFQLWGQGYMHRLLRCWLQGLSIFVF